MGNDVLNRNQTEAAPQEQNYLLQLTLQSMSDGIIVVNEQGQILVFNAAAERMFGTNAVQIDKHEWLQQLALFLPDQVTPLPAEELPLARALQGEETKDLELFVRHPQAPHGFWMLLNGKPLKDESGRLKGGMVVCQDISDRKRVEDQRKQAEDALKYSLERYHSLVTATSQIVWVSTPEGLCFDVKDWIAYTGQTEAEAQGSGWLDAVHPDDRHRTAEVWATATKNRSLYKVEYRIRAKDGTYRDFFVCGSPILGEDGHVQEWIGICTDITDRKLAEQKLQQNEERFRCLVTATSQIIWDTKAEGEFVAAQPGWSAFTGQSFEELKGWGWLNAIHPEDQAHTAQVWSTALTNRSLYEVEHRLRRHDGKYRHMSVRAVPILDSDGNVREWIGVHNDITDRKRAEIALRQSEERLQAILDNSPAVIYMKDTEGRFITVNRQFESLFHMSKAELIGKRNSDLFEPELAAAFNANDQKVLEARTAMQWEELAPHDDGLHSYLSLKFPLLTPEGIPYAICGISTDITDRKQAELALEQAKEAAEAANRAKSEFLANMSHELRTPLNGVIGYAQILQRTKTLSEEDRSRIEIIHQCGSHLLTLINDILDLSKIEAQKTELLPTDFHFPAFLQGVAEMCRIRAELKGIQFRYESAAELPIGVRADEKRLRQVLINLLSNAIKFTDAGSVTFKVSFASAGKIRFAVQDTGIGVPQEKLQAIFQPFEQVSDASRQSEGTGLGLAISQEIAELMGSKIQVQSEVGVGSIFWLDVELAQADEWVKTAQADRHGQIIGISNRQPRLLVIDDKWENRSVISTLLKPIGFEVLEAVDGNDGWQKLLESRPDLVITDLLMPGLDGIELINRIRASEAFKDLIIIVSSASVFEADQYRSIEAGGNDFLPKPVLAGELLQKLQKHLKLQWIYEEHQPWVQPNAASVELVPPPAQELELLYELARKGNFIGISKQAVLLEQLDAKYSPFAKKLHQLAKGFQDQEILALIQSY